jgi:hypothetical protein
VSTRRPPLPRDTTLCAHVRAAVAGKSALLTALVLGLGGKAVNTDRGNSLRDFIKDGARYVSVRPRGLRPPRRLSIARSCSEAKITVTLYNRGHEPYRASQYGGVVRVRRIIREKGASDYTLLNAQSTRRAAGGWVGAGADPVGTDKVVEHGRQALDALLDHYSITIDNPLSVLSQEVAKRFLATARPQELYRVRFASRHAAQPGELGERGPPHDSTMQRETDSVFPQGDAAGAGGGGPERRGRGMRDHAPQPGKQEARTWVPHHGYPNASRRLDARGPRWQDLGEMKATTLQAKERMLSIRPQLDMEAQVAQLRETMGWALVAEKEKVRRYLSKATQRYAHMCCRRTQEVERAQATCDDLDKDTGQLRQSAHDLAVRALCQCAASSLP